MPARSDTPRTLTPSGDARGRPSLLALLPLLLLLLAGTSVPASAQGSAEPAVDPEGRLVPAHLALTNTHVVNVRTGEILRDAVVVVEDGLIASVGTGDPPPGVEIRDMEGQYLVPGFMDGHWHGQSLRNLRRALESGVTTMKSASAGGDMDLKMRAAVERGYLPGPEILASGVYVNRSPGNALLTDDRLFRYLNQEVQGEEAVREVVRVNADNGVDWIKTRSGGTASAPGGWDPRTEVYSEEVLTAMVEEASAHGIPVSCHAHGEHVIVIAVRAGCRTIEHGFYMTEEALEAMLEHGTIWNPTYYSTEGYLLPHDDYDSAASRLRGPYIVHNMRRMMRRAHEMGVPMITSTDTRYSDHSVTRVSGEIVSFVEHAGMTPLEALQSATILSAEVYGIGDRTGAIEEGLEADLVAFDQNPLEDIWVTRDPLFVMSNGHLIYHRTADPEHHIAPQVEWTGYGTGGPRP